MRKPNLLRRPLMLIALVIAFASQVSWASAHTGGNISGVVRDAQTGQPLAGVSLQISSPWQSETTTSDAQGHFIVFTLQPGVYTITADKPGYRPQAFLGYIVDAEETGLCDFKLGAPM
jgi:Carboxypeptidase regulatory-like domain